MRPEGGYIVGRHAVAEALRRRPGQVQELVVSASERSRAVRELVELARAAGVRVRRVEARRLERLAGGASHQGVALRLAAAGYTPFERLLAAVQEAGEEALVVVADHLEDPRNLGALARSAAGAGALGLVVAKDRACGLSPAAAKVAAGALERLMVARVTNLGRALEELKQAGLWALAAATRGAPSPWELDLARPLALVIGGEHRGLSPRLARLCDLETSLPLADGVESLNAAVAAGVLLFEVLRQRRAARGRGG